MRAPRKIAKGQLSEKQAEALEVLSDPEVKYVLYGGSANSGKTRVGCVWLLQMCMTYPKSKWLLGRCGIGILKQTSCDSFKKMLDEMDFVEDVDYYWNIHANNITFRNGSVIVLKDMTPLPSDPNFDNWGGTEYTGALLEEVSQFTEAAYETIKIRVGRWNNEKYGIPGRIFMTCNPGKNFTYTKFYKPWKDGTLPKHMRFVRALPTDNTLGSEEVLEAMRSNTDTLRYNRFYLGNWEYSGDPNTMVDYDNIIAMYSNSHVEVENGTRLSNGSLVPGNYITCDPSDGGDTTVMLVWKGLKVIDHFSYSGPDVTPDNNLKHVQRLQSAHFVPNKNVIVDGGGGYGTHILRSLNGSLEFLGGGPFPGYGSLRSACFYKLAECINSNEIWFPLDDSDTQARVTLEIEQLKRTKVEDDRIHVIPKSKMKEGLRGKSPDYLDALSMRMVPLLKNTTAPLFRTYVV